MTKIITVYLEEIIGLNLEGFLELLEERCEEGVLIEQRYEVVGTNHGAIQLKVTADVYQECP